MLQATRPNQHNNNHTKRAAKRTKWIKTFGFSASAFSRTAEKTKIKCEIRTNGDNVQQSHNQELLSCSPDDSYLSVTFASCRAIDLNVLTCVVPKAIRLTRRSSSCHSHSTHTHTCIHIARGVADVAWTFVSTGLTPRKRFRCECPPPPGVIVYSVIFYHWYQRQFIFCRTIFNSSVVFRFNSFEMELLFRHWCLASMGQQLLQNILHPTRKIRVQKYVWKTMTLAWHFYSFNVLACVTCSVPNLPNEKLALDQTSQTLNNHTKFSRFEVSWIETHWTSVEVCCMEKKK